MEQQTITVAWEREAQDGVLRGHFLLGPARLVVRVLLHYGLRQLGAYPVGFGDTTQPSFVVLMSLPVCLTPMVTGQIPEVGVMSAFLAEVLGKYQLLGLLPRVDDAPEE